MEDVIAELIVDFFGHMMSDSCAACHTHSDLCSATCPVCNYSVILCRPHLNARLARKGFLFKKTVYSCPRGCKAKVS